MPINEIDKRIKTQYKIKKILKDKRKKNEKKHELTAPVFDHVFVLCVSSARWGSSEKRNVKLAKKQLTVAVAHQRNVVCLLEERMVSLREDRERALRRRCDEAQRLWPRQQGRVSVNERSTAAEVVEKEVVGESTKWDVRKRGWIVPLFHVSWWWWWWCLVVQRVQRQQQV